MLRKKANIERVGHDDYFSGLNTLMREKGPGHPVLVLDLDILDKNLEALRTSMGALERFRLVVKSLPSLKLISYILERTRTRKLMVFHRPFLNLVLSSFPDVDILLGKPFPIQALNTFYRELATASRSNNDTKIQWLIDSQERLEQYRDAAHRMRREMHVNIEIDVGLHRGGVSEPKQLGPLLKIIADDPRHLHLAGFMGYDPHVAKSGKLLIPTRVALLQVARRYKKFINYLKADFPALYSERLTFNGAGSPTFSMYRKKSLLNDISVGSALVKPSNFDLKSLRAYEQALFIATPVLKKIEGIRIPYLESVGFILHKLKPRWRTTLFIYGGYWKAVPHSPAGLIINSLYGRSTNQEMLNGPANIDIGVDDYVFLRPSQSESVMLQFGDLFVVRGSEYVGRWPVFSQA